jgi:hypothetical protein
MVVVVHERRGWRRDRECVVEGSGRIEGRCILYPKRSLYHSLTKPTSPRPSGVLRFCMHLSSTYSDEIGGDAGIPLAV